MAGSLESLRIVLVTLKKHSGAFAYNVILCYLIAKPECVQKANKNFPGLDFEVFESNRVLG